MSTCRKAVSGKCRLTADVSCDRDGSTITPVSGNDLDLKGFDITCTETDTANPCNYDAITMLDSSSKVTSDGSGDDGVSVISGLFNTGVNCQSKSGSIVEKLTINDGVVAILNCQTVRNNVVGPTSQGAFFVNLGIQTSGVSNSDAINENYVTGRILPIFSSSPFTLDVQKNVVNTSSALIALELGNSQSVSNGTAKFNIFFGQGFGSTHFLIDTPATDHVSYDGKLL